jgi:hypothetical protein
MSPQAISYLYGVQKLIREGRGNRLEAFRILERLRILCFTLWRDRGDATYCYLLLLDAMDQRGWL